MQSSIAVSLATALTALSVTPAAFAFGGFHGADIPEEARTELKACHDSVLTKYGIEIPTFDDTQVKEETEGQRFGRKHFRGSNDLTPEQRQAMKEETQACKTSIAETYNLELPDRSSKRGFGRRGRRGGFFGAGMQDLSDADRSTIENLMQQIQDLMQKYQTSN